VFNRLPMAKGWEGGEKGVGANGYQRGIVVFQKITGEGTEEDGTDYRD